MFEVVGRGKEGFLFFGFVLFDIEGSRGFRLGCFELGRSGGRWFRLGGDFFERIGRQWLMREFLAK